LPAGPVSFGTNSDDGSAVYVDLNQDGIFESNELIVDSNGGHGTQQKVGTTPALAAGNYAVYIGYYESSGGGSMEARIAPGTQATYTSQLVIDPSSPAQAGIWAPLVVAANNNIIMNGTGRVELDGNNTYNGTTTVNSGTLEIDGVNSLSGDVNVNAGGTLAGVGTLPGNVNINGGGTLSPGKLGGTATGVISVGTLTFAAASPTPALDITINGSVVSPPASNEYDQVQVAGAATLNGAILNLTIGSSADSDSGPNQAYTFLDMTSGSAVNGIFAGHVFGSTITVNGNSYALSDTIDFEGNANSGGNDVGLVKQVSNNYFVSATWAGDAPNTVVTDSVLTDGQPATFGINAFATIQDALDAAANNSTATVTAVIVNPGTYGDTVVNIGNDANPAPSIVLQGTALPTSISIASLTDSSNPSASLTIPSGTTLTVGSDNNSSLFVGSILGAGSFIKAGTGNLTLNQNNVMSGPIEVAGGTLQLGDGNTIGTVGTGAIAVDAAGTLIFDEPGNSTTIVNQISGSGLVQLNGFSTIGSVTFADSGSTFSGGVSINGGRIVLGTATSIGNPATVSVASGGQFSFGTATNANFTGSLTIAGTGYSDGTIAGGVVTGAILFTGTSNTWSGPVSVNNATFGAFGAIGTISGAISGSSPTFGSNSTSTETFVLTGTNVWTDFTIIQNNASVNIGNNNTSGTLSTSTSGISLAGNTAYLDYDRTDTTTWGQTINGQGGIRIRHGGTLDFDGTTNNAGGGILLGSLVVGNGTVNFSGGETVNVSNAGGATGVTDVGDNLNAGLTVTSGTVTGIINVTSGATLISNTIDLGNNSTTGVVANGTINQTGGTVTITAAGTLPDGSGMRLGQWPTGSGSYSLSSGTLSIGGTGALGIAIDGTGNYVQTGGTASAFKIDVNTRPSGNGTGTFTLNGGLFQLGGGGLTADAGTATTNLGGGMLQATADFNIGTPVTLTGAVGAAVIDTQGHTVTDFSTVSGSGTLTKINSGQLSLIGTDTYTGGTTVTGGTVAVFNNAALGTGSVKLDGGTLKAGVLAGLIQGIISNAAFNTTTPNPGGAVTLNFLAGETNVEGNPAVSPWFSDPPGNQTIVYTGQFFVPASGQVAFAEQVDDNTLILIDGNQVLSDTAWNVATTTGVLNLTPGWHSIEARFGNGGGGAGASGTQGTSIGWSTTYGFGAQGIAGTGQTAAALTTETAGSVNGADFIAPIDPGDGSLFRAGAGASNIANNIVLGAGNGSIEIDGTDPVTFSGTISGAGALNNIGTGTAVLTGTDTYSGGTTVSAGSLIVNGSLSNTSTVSVSAAAILGGTGAVGTVNSAGTVNPGSAGSPGTINVNNLTLGPGTLVLDLSNTAADRVNASGSTVDLTGATLSLNVGTVTPGESFTILTVPGTSGGRTGTFVGLDGTPGNNTITAGGTTFTISYTGGDGNDVTLLAAGSSASLVSTVQNGGIAYVNSSLATHQHSMVENIVYSFSSAVSLSAANFSISALAGTTTNIPTLNAASDVTGTVWTVTFSGAGVNTATHSIGDGEYELVLSGVPGLASNTYDFFRLLGDMDGNGTVNTSDFATLVSTFLRATDDPLYLGADDFDGDNTIGTADFAQFTQNFLKTLPAPLGN
jgi:autotransporter-associated beta strand protein